MKTVKKITGISLAAAAATLLLAGCSSAEDVALGNVAANAAKVQCGGINSCQGKSSCKTATSSCKGQNNCKGQGWITATKSDCKSQGGNIIAMMSNTGSK